MHESISVIIPTRNEAAEIGRTINAVMGITGVEEVIVVDGGSDDETAAIATSAGCHVLQSPAGRGLQQHTGAIVAKGAILWFVHADTRVPLEAGRAILHHLQSEKNAAGGYFDVQFEGKRLASRFMTWFYRQLIWLRLCYGDSAYFIRREAYFDAGGFQNLPLFEDLDLLRRLRRQGSFSRLSETVVTSSRRFANHRFIPLFGRWVFLQILYWFGVSPRFLGKLYRSDHIDDWEYDATESAPSRS